MAINELSPLECFAHDGLAPDVVIRSVEVLMHSRRQLGLGITKTRKLVSCVPGVTNALKGPGSLIAELIPNAESLHRGAMWQSSTTLSELPQAR